jgi:hypothetical protein
MDGLVVGMTKAWHLKKNSIKHTGKYSKWNKK